MNNKKFVPVNSWNKPIIKGTLIGFTNSDNSYITASYPVWNTIGDEIQFVLYFNSNGKPVIDNTWRNSLNLCINKIPIIVEI